MSLGAPAELTRTASYTTPLTFRTEVRPYLYLASAGLLAIGLLFRRDLDLGALGETKIVVITGSRASQNTYLAFRPLAGSKLKPRPFTHPRLQEFAETVLLNGYIGSNLHGAKDIQRVIDQRQAEPRQELPPLRDDTAQRAAARARLKATAAVFAAAWIALVWWKLLP